MVEGVSESLVSHFNGGQKRDALSHLRALWLVRVVSSLLMDPAENEEQARKFVEIFGVPALLIAP